MLFFGVIRGSTENFYVSTNGNDDSTGDVNNPFKTISYGVSRLSTGDHLYIFPAKYFETNGITLRTSNVSISSTDTNKLATINCGISITNWNKCTLNELPFNSKYSKIYYTDLDTNLFASEINIFKSRWNHSSPPLNIFIDITNNLKYISRFPNGDSASKHAFIYEFQTNDTSFIDSFNLVQTNSEYWLGALMCVHTRIPDNTYEEPIVSFNPDLHEIIVVKDIDEHSGSTHDLSPTNTTYFIENSPNTIDEVGDWAVDVVRYPGRLYIMWGDDLNNHEIQIAYGQYGFFGDGVSNVILNNIKVEMAASTSIRFENGESNIINMCASVSGTGGGVILNKQNNSIVKHCITENVNNGLNVSLSSNCLVSNNFVSNSKADGIDVKSSTNITVIANCVRDTWFEAHPDGYQQYGDNTEKSMVEGINIFDNVFYNVGQGIQSSHSRNTTISNNVFVISHWSSMVSMSGFRSDVWMASLDPPFCANNLSNVFLFNTILDGGKSFGAFSKRIGNIFIPPVAAGSSDMGPSTGMIGVSGNADYNILWDRSGNYDNMGWRNDNGTLTYFDLPQEWNSYTNISQQDINGLFIDPQFVNSPLSRLDLDSNYYDLCDTNIFYLKSPSNLIVGNYIEIDGDSIPRKITTIVGNKITFDPSYYNKLLGRQTIHPQTYSWPDAQTRIFYWGSNTNFDWNTQLSSNSPGKHLFSPINRQVGSTLNIQNYLDGDFNGDGIRDVPYVYPISDKPARVKGFTKVENP